MVKRSIKKRGGKHEEFRTSERIKRLIRLLDPSLTKIALRVLEKNIQNVYLFMSDPNQARYLMDDSEFEKHRNIASDTLYKLIETL